jgi:hypothetical protein
MRRGDVKLPLNETAVEAVTRMAYSQNDTHDPEWRDGAMEFIRNQILWGDTQRRTQYEAVVWALTPQTPPDTRAATKREPRGFGRHLGVDVRIEERRGREWLENMAERLDKGGFRGWMQAGEDTELLVAAVTKELLHQAAAMEDHLPTMLLRICSMIETTAMLRKWELPTDRLAKTPETPETAPA